METPRAPRTRRVLSKKPRKALRPRRARRFEYVPASSASWRRSGDKRSRRRWKRRGRRGRGEFCRRNPEKLCDLGALGVLNPSRRPPLLGAAVGTRDRGDDRNAEIAEHAESFFKNIGKSSATSARSAFESVSASSASSALHRGTRDRGDDENAESAEDAESFVEETQKSSATSARSAFESVSASSASSTLQRGREIAETIETPRAPRTRRVLSTKTQKTP